jgi:putative membrane protein
MTPRDLGPGFHDHGAFFAFPFLAALLVLLALLTATVLHLARSGKLQLGRSGRSQPEEDAKRVLAERFARGDIDGQEFMERSSLLNWTPGVEEPRPRPRLPRLRG